MAQINQPMVVNDHVKDQCINKLLAIHDDFYEHDSLTNAVVQET